MITNLTDFDWLMLADNDLNEISLEILNSEPLSLHCPARNNPETTAHHPQNLAA